MNGLGIIAEYNPMHTGHISHMAASAQLTGADFIVVVMSGNFVQRGEPALIDKWRRTKMALVSGADLVLELPVRYACSSAGYFANAAVNILEKTGFVSSMCFGSEWSDIERLKKCAGLLLAENDIFKDRLREYLAKGASYPAARAKALSNLHELPDTPNNILGIEYIMALKILGSNIEPHTVPRADVSAKDIRRAYYRGEMDFVQKNMSPLCWEILHGSSCAEMDNLSSVLHYILYTEVNLNKFSDVSEGLENRIVKFARDNRLISEIIADVKTKRYTYLRLQRAVLHVILGIKKNDMLVDPQYIRILGFKESRADLLGKLLERASLPVVLNLKNANLPAQAMEMLEQEIRSSKIYSLAFPGHVYFDEYSIPIVKV